MQRLRRKTLFWLVPIFITIHNLEEAVFMPTFLRLRDSLVPVSLRGILPQVSYKQFLLALLIFTAIPYLIVLLWGNGRTGVYLVLCLQMVMLINVASHSLVSLFLGGYSPGLATALAINLPFSLYLLRRAWVERWVSRMAIGLTFAVGLMIHGPALLGLMLLSAQALGTI